MNEFEIKSVNGTSTSLNATDAPNVTKPVPKKTAASDQWKPKRDPQGKPEMPCK